MSGLLFDITIDDEGGDIDEGLSNQPINDDDDG